MHLRLLLVGQEASRPHVRSAVQHLYDSIFSSQSIRAKGAVSAAKDDKIISHPRNFGGYLGMAFQIRDDVPDYEVKTALLGKSIVGDIKETKVTLPFICAFENSARHEVRSVLRLVKNGKLGSRIGRVIEFAEYYGAMSRTRERSKGFVENARKQLECIRDSAPKDSLLSLTEFGGERVN